MDYSPQYRRFRALLRKIREEAGLSQRELGKKLGIRQTVISKIELGERSMDFLETLRFCAACQVSIGQLTRRLGLTGAKPKPGRSATRKKLAKTRLKG